MNITRVCGYRRASIYIVLDLLWSSLAGLELFCSLSFVLCRLYCGTHRSNLCTIKCTCSFQSETESTTQLFSFFNLIFGKNGRMNFEKSSIISRKAHFLTVHYSEMVVLDSLLYQIPPFSLLLRTFTELSRSISLPLWLMNMRTCLSNSFVLFPVMLRISVLVVKEVKSFLLHSSAQNFVLDPAKLNALIIFIQFIKIIYSPTQTEHIKQVEQKSLLITYQ